MIVNYNQNTSTSFKKKEKRCGWFCRRWKQLVGTVVAFATGGISGAIGYVAAHEWSRISFSDFVLGEDAEIDAREGKFLENWILKYLLPMYQSILDQADTILQESNLENQLAILNSVLDRIYLTKKYTSNLTYSQETPEGKELLIDYCDELMQEVEDVIATTLNSNQSSIAQYSKTVTSSLDAISILLYKDPRNLEPIYTVFSTTSLNYKKVVKDNQAGPIITNDSTITISDIPKSLEETIEANSPDQVNSESSNSLKYLGWSLLAFSIIRKLTKKEKK